MNGQAAYAAWIPAPPTPGQGMVRQMTPSSPFPVQMVAYPPPGTPTLYNTAAMSPQMQQAGIAQPRSRNPPIGSPVVAPAAAVGIGLIGALRVVAPPQEAFLDSCSG